MSSWLVQKSRGSALPDEYLFSNPNHKTLFDVSTTCYYLPIKEVWLAMQTVETKGVTPVLAFLIMLTAFPVAGTICTIYYQNASAFYESLMAVPIAAVAGPIGFLFLSGLIQRLHSGMLGIVLQRTMGLFSGTVLIRTLLAIGVIEATALFLCFS